MTRRKDPGWLGRAEADRRGDSALRPRPGRGGPDRDPVSDGNGLWGSLQGHYAVLDQDRVPARLRQARDHLSGDLEADLLVRALEDGQRVGTANDPGESAVCVDH